MSILRLYNVPLRSVSNKHKFQRTFWAHAGASIQKNPNYSPTLNRARGTFFEVGVLRKVRAKQAEHKLAWGPGARHRAAGGVQG